jgi:hypothetical protein
VKSDHWGFYIAVMFIVCVGTMAAVDPKKSTLRKWLYWCIAPLIGALCGGLAYSTVVAALWIGALWAVFFTFAYFRYWV